VAKLVLTRFTAVAFKALTPSRATGPRLIASARDTLPLHFEIKPA